MALDKPPFLEKWMVNASLLVSEILSSFFFPYFFAKKLPSEQPCGRVRRFALAFWLAIQTCTLRARSGPWVKLLTQTIVSLRLSRNGDRNAVINHDLAIIYVQWPCRIRNHPPSQGMWSSIYRSGPECRGNGSLTQANYFSVYLAYLPTLWIYQKYSCAFCSFHC